jgi:hypothetical protein
MHIPAAAVGQLLYAWCAGVEHEAQLWAAEIMRCCALPGDVLIGSFDGVCDLHTAAAHRRSLKMQRQHQNLCNLSS